MARKITMFELHFDGARFGPTFGKSDDEDAETAEEYEDVDESHEESSGGSKLRPLLVFAGVALLVVAVRRLRSRGGEEDYDIPLEEDTESVAAEQ